MKTVNKDEIFYDFLYLKTQTVKMEFYLKFDFIFQFPFPIQHVMLVNFPFSFKINLFLRGRILNWAKIYFLRHI